MNATPDTPDTTPADTTPADATPPVADRRAWPPLNGATLLEHTPIPGGGVQFLADRGTDTHRYVLACAHKLTDREWYDGRYYSDLGRAMYEYGRRIAHHYRHSAPPAPDTTAEDERAAAFLAEARQVFGRLEDFTFRYSEDGAKEVVEFHHDGCGHLYDIEDHSSAYFLWRELIEHQCATTATTAHAARAVTT